jgi:hypothetical protein
MMHSNGVEQDQPSGEGPERPVDEPQSAMDDLAPATAQLIRRFLAQSCLKGGASPSDVAALYTAPEIVTDPEATAYLDRRYVDGELPRGWRELQDDLSEAALGAPSGTTPEALLELVERRAPRPARSIFDDPDDLDDDGQRCDARLIGRDPLLEDLNEESRRAIEGHIVSEALGHGLAAIHTMHLRDRLEASSDERALQYLDLPWEHGARPTDWDELRDSALRLRARFEARGQDPTDAFQRAAAQHPGLDAAAILTLLAEEADRR